MWFYFSFGPYVADDGVATTNHKGLSVSSPAFTLTAPPPGPVPGDVDHPKWLAFMTHTSSAGYAGFDTEGGYVTSCEARVGGETYGTERNPFGIDADHPALAASAFVSADFETFMIFDFFLTNDRIYALYERLPYGRTPENHYASFTHLVPVATRDRGDMHDLKITYDRSAKTVSWFVGNEKVFTVDRIGFYLPNRGYRAIDRGGVEQDVGELKQLVCGFGMFTLHDAYDAEKNKSLVRLVDTPPDYYLHPVTGGQLEFVDETSEDGSRLWGQGARISVEKVVVSKSRSKAK